MSATQQEFAAAQYGVRAQDYVSSAVHSAGEDLDEIARLLAAAPAVRALDLGCGGGHVSYRAAPHAGEVVACDISQPMLDAVTATAAARGLANIRTACAPAERLPFADAAFDVVLSRFSAHHWHDLDAGLREARRVLAPQGRAIFIDTIAPSEPVFDSHLQTVELLRDISHVRNYRVEEWLAALGRAGFAATGLSRRIMRMEFATWIARTRASAVHADAIRSLLTGAPAGVRQHFAVGEDGSFDLEAVTIFAAGI